MDTWATSSLTPQIATGWSDDDDLHQRSYPMDVRPRRTRSSAPGCSQRVVRAQLRNGTAPWSHDHFGLDPRPRPQEDVEVQGNVVVPTEILDKYGADAVRWRAATVRPGMDSPFDETQMKVGRRLAIRR